VTVQSIVLVAAGARAIGVAVVDEHPVVRTLIRHFLECDSTVRVLAETGSGSDVFALIRRHVPQVVVIDLQPHVSGVLDLIRRVRREEPGTDFLVLTACNEDAAVVGTLDAGVKGYLLKTADGDDLLRAIRRISRGGRRWTPNLRLMCRRELRRSAQTLSRRHVSS